MLGTYSGLPGRDPTLTSLRLSFNKSGASVSAAVTLNSPPEGVPEPGTLAALACGLPFLGLAGYRALRRPLGTLKETTTQLELVNGSRIVSLPGKEETIRSFQGVNLLILDEAARIPDDLYGSVSPMTGVRRGRTSGGSSGVLEGLRRVACLAQPYGRRGQCGDAGVRSQGNDDL